MRLWPGRRDTARWTTGCAQVIRVLQAHLDGETDEATTQQVLAHLDDCHDCLLEADLYREIKKSLARQERPDPRAVERLRAFGESLLGPGPDAEDDRYPAGDSHLPL
ncbi:zf-HC2 domain-containing protein [Streptomyces sp. NPDC058067]|uniref:zf-HC2 domain-containing protein n=1 Tax=Streptomyces sp. NPDC058067 TaxID=3346324 RepID=UPI0036EC1EF9